MVDRWILGISFFVGRDDSARRSITGGSPRGTRRFFEGGFAGFLSEAPPAPPTRRASPFLPEEMGRKKGRGASPALDPPVPGLMAAVCCLWPAKTGRASPQVFLVVLSQALPRLGRHASGLPCKPWEWFRCAGLARRAAVGTMPLKYLGGHSSNL